MHKANVSNAQSRKTDAHQQDMHHIQKEAHQEASRKNKEDLDKEQKATLARMAQTEKNLVEKAKQMALKGNDDGCQHCLIYF